MASGNGSAFGLIKATVSDFSRDECGVRAAALAYYTIFALTPLLVLLVTIAGLIWSPAEVQRAIESQFSGMVGQQGGEQIHQMVAHGRSSPGGGIVATIASTAGLLLGATGAFLSLQDALNRAWNVKPDPSQGGVRVFLTKRLLSAGMVLGLGFLLAVSLALTAGISAAGGMLGGGMPKVAMEVINFIASFVVLGLLFAAMFKVLPDAEVSWRDVWVGGAATALLFVIGKVVIGLYLGRSKPGDAFGAASALAVVLVWTYYAGMIVLLGAEFTQQWATQRGGGIRPEKGAVLADTTADGNGTTEATKGATALRPGEEAGAGIAANTRGTVRARGGMSDWLIGLPMLLLLTRKRRSDRDG